MVMNLRQITLISALLLFILIFSCEEPAKEELDIPDTPSSLIYNFSGNWSLIAWIPIDCPGCYDYHYYISGGGLRFNSLYYDLKISYLFRNLHIDQNVYFCGLIICSRPWIICVSGIDTPAVHENSICEIKCLILPLRLEFQVSITQGCVKKAGALTLIFLYP